MKKVHTEEQIVEILRGHEANGISVREYCRVKGIHETTFYNWKKRYGSMDVEEVRQLKTLQQENGRSIRSSRKAKWASSQKQKLRISAMPLKTF
jgi:putative transposase